MVGDPKLVEEAKYGGENPCSAEELAYRPMVQQAQLGAVHLENRATDFQSSGAADWARWPNGGKEDPKETDASEVQALAGAYLQVKNEGNAK